MADLKINPHSPFTNIAPATRSTPVEKSVDVATPEETTHNQDDALLEQRKRAPAAVVAQPLQNQSLEPLMTEGLTRVSNTESEIKAKAKTGAIPAPVVSQQLNPAMQNAEKALDTVKAIASTQHSSLAKEDNVRKMVDSSVALAQAIKTDMRRLELIEQSLQHHNQKADAQNYEINQLQDLMIGLTQINDDKLDLSKEDASKGEDHSKMRFMIDYAKARGIQFKSYGWSSEQERSSLLKALEYKVHSLQTQSKKADIQLQHTLENYSAQVMWVSTKIKMLFDVIKQIISRMHN